mgnify:FL=1
MVVRHASFAGRQGEFLRRLGVPLLLHGRGVYRPVPLSVEVRRFYFTTGPVVNPSPSPKSSLPRAAAASATPADSGGAAAMGAGPATSNPTTKGDDTKPRKPGQPTPGNKYADLVRYNKDTNELGEASDGNLKMRSIYWSIVYASAILGMLSWSPYYFPTLASATYEEYADNAEESATTRSSSDAPPAKVV